jgi:hypothetical protein
MDFLEQVRDEHFWLRSLTLTSRIFSWLAECYVQIPMLTAPCLQRAIELYDSTGTMLLDLFFWRGSVTQRVARWYIFKPKIANFGKYWNVLQWKMLVNFTAIRSILLPFRIFYGHLVYFVGTLLYVFPFWYVVPRKIWQPWWHRSP